MKDLRKSFFIEPKLQLRVVMGMSAMGVLTVLVLLGSIRYFDGDIRARMAASGLAPDHPLFTSLAEREKSLLAFAFASGFLLLGLFNGIGLLLLHRIAGPLHRLKFHCESVSRGETEKDLSFRQGDHFSEVAAAFNGVMARLRAKR